MEPDIVISIRYNNILPIRQKYKNESEITWRIKELMEEYENEIKGLTTEVIEIDDTEQKAIEIGKNILSLIEEKAQEKIDEIHLCRG